MTAFRPRGSGEGLPPDGRTAASSSTHARPTAPRAVAGRRSSASAPQPDFPPSTSPSQSTPATPPISPARAPADHACVVPWAATAPSTRWSTASSTTTAPSAPTCVLAIVPRGTGADFVRTLGIPHDLEAAAPRLTRGQRARGGRGEGPLPRLRRQRDRSASSSTRRRSAWAPPSCQAVNRSSKRLGPRLSLPEGHPGRHCSATATSGSLSPWTAATPMSISC